MPQQGNVVSNKANKRTKPSELQLNRYQSAADRDVLCWIFENQGKCRYGEKCQWLHLDRETGQYIPTVYIMNSLDTAPYKKDKNDEEDKEIDPQELKNKFQLLMEKTIKKNMI